MIIHCNNACQAKCLTCIYEEPAEYAGRVYYYNKEQASCNVRELANSDELMPIEEWVSIKQNELAFSKLSEEEQREIIFDSK